jgi:cell division cycle 2-like protein
MHKKCIVHHDIKSENLLISDDGRAIKICDLGMVISMSDVPPYETNVGTLWYIAPKLLLEKEDFEAFVDS